MLFYVTINFPHLTLSFKIPKPIKRYYKYLIFYEIENRNLKYEIVDMSRRITKQCKIVDKKITNKELSNGLYLLNLQF